MTENEIIIAYGTETGNAEMLAEDAANAASDFNLEGRVCDMEDLSVDDLSSASRVMIVCSTWGEGDQPDNAQDLYDDVCDSAEDSWSLAIPDPLQEHADGIIEHMNEDHDDAMLIMCQKMSKAVDTTEVVMTGIDRYGFEMSALTGDGPRPIRLGFENEATTPDEARIEIVALVKKARAME